ncbi:MSH2 protein [Lecanora helva]
MSLEPMSLVLGDKALAGDYDAYVLGGNDPTDEEERAQRRRLMEKLKLHTVIRRSQSQKEALLSVILAQINCSAEMANLVTKNAYLLGTRQKRSLSVGEKVVESATTFRDYVFKMAWHTITVWIYPLLTKGFVLGLICHRFIAEIILRVLEWRIRPDSAALKDVSATAQQVDIRLQQFCYWPIQYLTLRKRKEDWESVNDRHPDYIRFYNSLWLVANDVIIGIAIGSYIIDNATWVAWQINTVLSGWTVDGLKDTIYWLMDWPAGLKLNTELAVFLGDLFVWVIDRWKGLSIDC